MIKITCVKFESNLLLFRGPTEHRKFGVHGFNKDHMAAIRIMYENMYQML